MLGDLREIRNDPLGLFARAAAEHDDLVRFKAAHRDVYLAVGAGPIARIAVANRDNYVKGVSYDALRVPIGDALLTADGDTWLARRRLLRPVFTRRTLVEQVPAMTAAVEALLARWDGYAAAGSAFNVCSEMNRLAFDMVGRVLTGAPLGDSMTELEELIEDASEWVARRTRALVPLPPVLPTPRNRRYRRAETRIRAFTERLIERRRREPGRGDMVGRLISARGEDGAGMDDRELRDEIIGFLMAGHQTTGAALAWTWYLVARHPEVARRLAAEADDVLGGRMPEADDLERLGYAGQVLDETMRLYPPGWAFTRTPLADDVLAGRRVRRGSVVVICSYANQRNPRAWPDPERFDPDRWDPDRSAPPRAAFFPFGVGPTACIGKHLALMEAKVAVAALAQRYELELVTRGPVGATPAITLTPSDPIMVRARRRERHTPTAKAAMVAPT